MVSRCYLIRVKGGKLRHALYAICLNRVLAANILTYKELIKMFKIKSKYLSSVSKNIEDIKPIIPKNIVLCYL